MDKFIIKSGRKTPALEIWSEKSVRIWFNKLAQFDRIGYVTYIYKIKLNMTEMLFMVMMVGYCANSGPGNYFLYNLKKEGYFFQDVFIYLSLKSLMQPVILISLATNQASVKIYQWV